MRGLMGGLIPPWSAACSLGHAPARDHGRTGPWWGRSSRGGLCTLEQTAAGLGEQEGLGWGWEGRSLQELWGQGQGTAWKRHYALSPHGPFIEYGAAPSPVWGPGAAGCDAPLIPGGRGGPRCSGCREESLPAVRGYRWSWKTSMTRGFSSPRSDRGAESPTTLHWSPATVLELW